VGRWGWGCGEGGYVYGQCHGDRRDGEPSPPPGNRGEGMEAESRQLGTEKQKGSTLEFEHLFATTISRGAQASRKHVMSFRGQRLLKTAATPPQIRQPQHQNPA
jgi:hypothetical protein